MGRFEQWIRTSGGWSEAAEDSSAPSGAWLHVDIYDSDIATLQWSPTMGGTGVAYVGFTPRVYFEDPESSAPTDPDLEAAALGRWIVEQVGGDAAHVTELVRACLADDTEPDDEDDDLDDDEDLDSDEYAFTEERVDRLFTEVGLGSPFHQESA